jgi:hypothetical protein
VQRHLQLEAVLPEEAVKYLLYAAQVSVQSLLEQV